jgi:hypothetical protein
VMRPNRGVLCGSAEVARVGDAELGAACGERVLVLLLVLGPMGELRCGRGGVRVEYEDGRGQRMHAHAGIPDAEVAGGGFPAEAQSRGADWNGATQEIGNAQGAGFVRPFRARIFWNGLPRGSTPGFRRLPRWGRGADLLI